MTFCSNLGAPAWNEEIFLLHILVAFVLNHGV
jgi:hypothetical protein